MLGGKNSAVPNVSLVDSYKNRRAVVPYTCFMHCVDTRPCSSLSKPAIVNLLLQKFAYINQGVSSHSAFSTPEPIFAGLYLMPGMGQMADSSNSITQPTEPREEDLDASIDADINQDPATQPDGKTLEPNSADDIDGVPEVAEPRILTKKDATLREFLNKMDDHAPIVSRPDPLCPFARVWKHYLAVLT